MCKKKTLRTHFKSKFPTIVCLCGSTRFLDEFEKQQLKLTLENKIVLTLGTHTPLARQYADGFENKKESLDELHFRKIELADEVLVLNVGGYIGRSTRREIEHARQTGKRVCFLEK